MVSVVENKKTIMTCHNINKTFFLGRKIKIPVRQHTGFWHPTWLSRVHNNMKGAWRRVPLFVRRGARWWAADLVCISSRYILQTRASSSEKLPF